MRKYFNENITVSEKENITRQKLSKEIKTVRKSNGLSQKEFADIIGLTGGKTCISLIENGKKIMPSSYMPIIADLSERSVESFYSDRTIKEYGNVFSECLKNMGYNDEESREALEYTQSLTEKAIKNIGSAKLFDYMFSILRTVSTQQDNSDKIIDEMILIETTNYSDNLSRYEGYIRKIMELKK